jgi:hypothetical protein
LRPAGFENSAPSSLELLPFIWMQMIAYALNFDFYSSALYVYNLLYCFMKKKRGGGTEFDQCLEKCLKRSQAKMRFMRSFCLCQLRPDTAIWKKKEKWVI